MDIRYIIAGQFISTLWFFKLQTSSADDVAISILSSLYFFIPNMIALIEFERKKVIDAHNRKDFSIPKVAEILERTSATIKKLIETRKLQAISDGRRTTHEALHDYLRIKD